MVIFKLLKVFNYYHFFLFCQIFSFSAHLFFSFLYFLFFSQFFFSYLPSFLTSLLSHLPLLPPPSPLPLLPPPTSLPSHPPPLSPSSHLPPLPPPFSLTSLLFHLPSSLTFPPFPNQDTWIVTGGTRDGVMRVVGDAVKDYMLEDGAYKQALVVVGIASLGTVWHADDLARYVSISFFSFFLLLFFVFFHFFIFFLAFLFKKRFEIKIKI